MSSSFEMINPVTARVSVTVVEEDVTKALDKAYATLRRTAQVRGFRRGKTPRNVLQRLYGSAILNEVRGEIINAQLLNALIENELDPISPPELDAPELSGRGDFVFSASFEVRPKIDKIDYAGIELERLKVSVSDDDVSAELEKIQKALASVSDLAEQRPARIGDVAVIALKRWKDGAWDEGGFPEQEVILGEGQAPAKLEEGIAGMSIDEEKVIDLGSETDMEDERMRYLVTLKALKERKLPEIDDELAKDTGKYETLDELKAEIEKRLLEARNQQEDHRLRHALFEKLCEKNPVVLPNTLVERHAEALRGQLMNQMGGALSGEKAQDILKSLEAGSRKSAEEMVHQHLLTLAIAKIENIKVDDADLDKEMASQADAAGIPLPMLKAELNKENRRQEMMSMLLERKIFDFAKSSVKITEVDALTEPETKTDGTGTSSLESADENAKEPTSKEVEMTEAAADDAALSGDDGIKKKTKTAKSTTKKTSEKKTDTASKKKPAANKSAAKKTTAKKTATKKTTTKKTAEKKSTTDTQ